MTIWDNNCKVDKNILKFTVGNDYILDKYLVKYDCIASIAHAKMLEKMGYITEKECKELTNELKNIIQLDKKGKFKIKLEDEDCHSAIEKHLTEKLGKTGKKIHFARSRNDQVLTALRLFYKEKIKEINGLIDNFESELNNFKKKYGKIKLAGYTHTRKAMPSSIELYINCFIDSMKDNKVQLKNCLKLINQLPLGTGASYGLPIKIDRNFLKEELAFSKIQKNALYVQNSRGKFENSILHSFSQIMFDLNKLSTDIILFSTDEFGYIDLPDTFCLGSSIMPQKKNPDVFELIRAKYHQIISYEFQIKSLIANLPSGYNRDLQLTKGPMIKSILLTIESLKIYSYIFKCITVNKKKCKDSLTNELYATKEAYQLSLKNIAFRDAYSTIKNKKDF
jgi:argininosuccinate lyase